MAKINTLNYQTVASWNGSQDLFVVEQPDGTKVATPAMVKQFIEAGNFIATGEIIDGHGNILADMAKSADVAAEIGDLSETGLTGDSVAEQLDTAGEQIAGINNSLLPIDGVVKRFYILSPNVALNTGINVNNTYCLGFVAFVSSQRSYNNGIMSLYIGGVPHRKEDGTVGDLAVTKLGGIGLGVGGDAENLIFSIVDDKLQIKSVSGQGAVSVTMILSKKL